jgi:hypothetical protein
MTVLRQQWPLVPTKPPITAGISTFGASISNLLPINTRSTRRRPCSPLPLESMTMLSTPAHVGTKSTRQFTQAPSLSRPPSSSTSVAFCESVALPIPVCCSGSPPFEEIKVEQSLRLRPASSPAAVLGQAIEDLADPKRIGRTRSQKYA